MNQAKPCRLVILPTPDTLFHPFTHQIIIIHPLVPSFIHSLNHIHLTAHDSVQDNQARRSCMPDRTSAPHILAFKIVCRRLDAFPNRSWISRGQSPSSESVVWTASTCTLWQAWSPGLNWRWWFQTLSDSLSFLKSVSSHDCLRFFGIPYDSAQKRNPSCTKLAPWHRLLMPLAVRSAHPPHKLVCSIFAEYIGSALLPEFASKQQACLVYTKKQAFVF